MVKKIILFLIFFLYFLFLNKKYLYAQEVFFQDDFNQTFLDLNKWEISTNSGNIFLENGFLKLFSNKNSFPYIYPKDKKIIIPQNENFTIEIGFNYLNIGVWGNGIVLSDNIPPLGVPPPNDYTVFGIWQDVSPLRLAFNKLCPEINPSCNPKLEEFYQTKNNDFDYHTLKINYKAKKYTIFFDNNLIFTSASTTIRPKFIWIGNTLFTNQNNIWTSFQIDFIKVFSYKSFSPLLLLPGLGGSWNAEALLFDKEGNNWHKPPIDIYQNFRQTMLNNGYTLGQNYDEFYYDWRKELDNPYLATESLTNVYSVKDLKDKIDNFYNANSNQKITLVGHSLGGLLARTYLQRYGSEKINKIITVGSPHYGAVNAYNVWEGAEIIDSRRPTFYALFMEAITFWRQRYFNYISKLETIRKTAPSIRNLIPTFNFLINTGGQVIEADKIKQKNDLLLSLNQNLDSSLKNFLKTLSGKENDPNHDTLEWLKVMKPTVSDIKLGLWEDGKPYMEFGSEEGDLTVLLKSASISGITNFQIEGIHDQLIQKEEGLNKILEILELNSPAVVKPPLLIKIPLLFFWLHSPANLKVSGGGIEAGFNAENCSYCYYSPEDNFILINEAPTSDYSLILTPKEEGGDYELDIAQITNQGSFWYRLTGKIKSEENYQLHFDPQQPQNPPLIDNNQYYQQTLNKLNKLKEYLEKQQITKSAKKVLITKIDLILKILNKDKNEKTILLALTGVFECRLEVDKFFKQNKLNEIQRQYLKQTTEDIIIDLKTTYLGLTDDQKLNKELLEKNLELIQRDYQKLNQEIQNDDSLNLPLGNIMKLLESMLNQAQLHLDEEKLKESFIDIFGARFLLKEAKNLI